MLLYSLTRSPFIAFTFTPSLTNSRLAHLLTYLLNLTNRHPPTTQQQEHSKEEGGWLEKFELPLLCRATPEIYAEFGNPLLLPG